MIYSTPDTRAISWGDSGMSFLERKELVARIDFPVGPQGPADGLLGSKERGRWLLIQEAWIEQGMLPIGAYFPKGLKRGGYSLQYTLPVGGAMISWEKLDEYKTPTVKACKNCGNTYDKHELVSLGGAVFNAWCPEEGHTWGSTRTLWREV